MNYSKNIFTGVWPALFTPVDKHGQLNERELEKLIDLMVLQRVDGLYILGSTGQGFLFEESHRKKIAEAAMQMAHKRLPVIIQVGAMNTDESVRLAMHAAACGADGVSSVGPIYYSSTVTMAFEHYRKIAEATELPFFPYQIGNSASTRETISKLMEVKNIRGMKLTTPNLVEIGNIYNMVPEWHLFSGSDELLCHAALCGTRGAIGTTYNFFGDTCRYVRQEFLNGNVQMATEFMLKFQQFIDRVLPYVWTFFRRALVIRHAIDIGNPRPPLLSTPLPWSDSEIIDMIEDLEAFAKVNRPVTE